MFILICIHLVGSTERFIVLDAIEILVERRKLDNDLRRQYQESEARVALLEIKLAQRSNESDTGSGLPINTHIALGGPDIDAGLCSWP